MFGHVSGTSSFCAAKIRVEQKVITTLSTCMRRAPSERLAIEHRATLCSSGHTFGVCHLCILLRLLLLGSCDPKCPDRHSLTAKLHNMHGHAHTGGPMNGPGAAPSASGVAIPGAILKHRTYSCGSGGGGSTLILACDGVFSITYAPPHSARPCSAVSHCTNCPAAIAAVQGPLGTGLVTSPTPFCKYFRFQHAMPKPSSNGRKSQNCQVC